MKKKSLTLIALAALALAVSACNTVSGAGKDLSSAGRATTEAAEESKP